MAIPPQAMYVRRAVPLQPHPCRPAHPLFQQSPEGDRQDADARRAEHICGLAASRVNAALALPSRVSRDLVAVLRY